MAPRRVRARKGRGGAALVFLLGLLLAGPGAAEASARRPLDVIVVLRPSATDPAAVAAEHSARYAARVRYVYRHSLRGYAASLPPASVARLAADPRVASVEPDAIMRTATTQNDPPWGLDRIDQRALPLDQAYTYGGTGADVKAYVIDTGVRVTHVEFGGRAVSGYDAVDGGAADDCHGHGTHVSGTIGGATYGVAKQVRLVGVRVLDCTGTGATSGVIAGVDWVTGDHVAGAPAVANMSLGGGASTALDTAVRNSIADGVSYAIAAGNGDLLGNPQDACSGSPARVGEAMTIGATDQTDRKASWSNYGSCVDWFAPGVGVVSAWNSSDTATESASGTSMASPHTAGVAALHLQLTPAATPAEVRTVLYDLATKGVVTQSSTANNHLLHSAPGPTVTLDRLSVAYAAQDVGTVSAAQMVTVSNAGTADLVIGAATIAGPNVGDFAKTGDGCSGVTVAPGGGCAIDVAFTPTTSGARNASLTIPSNALGSPHVVALAGTGVAPAVAVSPASLSFGAQAVGGVSSPKTVTVTNTGSAALAVGTVVVSGQNAADFAKVDDACSGWSVSPGAGCTVRVSFAPGGDGARAASLSIPSNGTGSPVIVPMSGTGVGPTAVSINPAALSFSAQVIGSASAAQSVTITNAGAAGLAVSSIAVGGTNPGDFAKVADGCTGVIVPPGSSCTVQGRFVPTATGARAAALVITSNATGSPHSVAMSGTGTAPAMSISPSSLSFAAQSVGSTGPPKTVTVGNSGTSPFTISGAQTSGTAAADFVKAADTCTGAILGVGLSCSIQIAFRPTVPGARMAALVVSSDAPGGSRSVALSGSGAAPVVQLEPASLAFDAVRIGATSARRTITVSNGGDDALRVEAVSPEGVDAGDFVVVADTCSGASVAPGGGCRIEVTFSPGAQGLRQGALAVRSNAPGSPRSAGLSGMGDGSAPVSTFVTRDRAVLLGGYQALSGATTDDIAGTATATMTVTSVTGSTSTVSLTLGCDQARTLCRWSTASPLVPGVYVVNVRATDQTGNAEDPGPSITIFVA